MYKSDKCADTLAKFCLKAMPSLTLPSPNPRQDLKQKPTVSSWKLKAMICVFRHADRTPKSMIQLLFISLFIIFWDQAGFPENFDILFASACFAMALP
jgi:hypothetical protein